MLDLVAIVLRTYYTTVAIVFVFCFFKQKTAYEMRISDWSSDVCSSDLCPQRLPATGWPADAAAARSAPVRRDNTVPSAAHRPACGRQTQIGRASCRERVCQYV